MVVPTKVFIGNLPPNCPKQKLQQELEKFGKIVEFDIVADYAFAHYESADDAKDVVEYMNGKEFLGKRLKVELSRSRARQKPGEGWKKECFSCGGEGHGQWSDLCPNNTKNVGSTKVYLGNLPENCPKQELQEELESYGKVVEFDILSNYGFAHYENVEEAKQAIENMNGKEFLGKKIQVEFSFSRARQKPGMGGKKECYRCGREGHWQWSKECPANPANVSATKVFIGNLPERCDKAKLQQQLESYGKILEFDILSTYGFAHYENFDDANDAIENMNGSYFMGKRLKVELSSSRVRQKPGMGGKMECFRCGGFGHWSEECPRDRPSFYEEEYLRRLPSPRDLYARDPYADLLRSRYPLPPLDRYRPYPSLYERRRLPPAPLPPPRDLYSKDPYERPPPDYYASRAASDAYGMYYERVYGRLPPPSVPRSTGRDSPLQSHLLPRP